MYYQDQKTGAARTTNLSALGNVFDVWLWSDADKTLEAAVRDAGFGKIVSIAVAFHKVGPFTVDPETNERTYLDRTPVRKFYLSSEQLATQKEASYEKSLRKSWSLSTAGFKEIDAKQWEAGLWDMWIISEDDLGNKGMAPYSGTELLMSQGKYLSRKIEIK